MPELQASETEKNDLQSSILAGYLTPKDLAHALGVSERTIARWHRFREDRHASNSVGRSITVSNR